MSKGFPLPFLGIAMACMSLFVIIAEVPSGIFCDAKGRRMSFQLGMMFTFVGTLLLFSSSFFMVCLGFSLHGLGRAFSSGSLDALYIEEAQDNGKTLEEALFALEVTSSLSLAIGALIGGYLLMVGKEGSTLTHPILIGRIILVGINIVLIPLIISHETTKGARRKVSLQISLLVDTLTTQPQILVYVITVVVQGIYVSSIETYWQPYVKRLLLHDSQLWVLGVMASVIFVMSILGAYVGKTLLKHLRAQILYIILFFIDFILLGLLSRAMSLALFLFLYFSIYIVLGALMIAGGTLLNQRIENSVRSSVLSLSSFSLQMGGVLSSLSSVIILSYVGISGFWILVAISGAIILLVTSKRL